MNVTMQIDRSAISVYVHDTGHNYSVSELNRIIRQLTTAKSWLASERAKQTTPVVVAEQTKVATK